MSYRIILYGYGKKFHQQKQNLSGCEIVAIADKNADALRTNYKDSYPLIVPEEISNYAYDYVAISSPIYFEAIKQQLICENGVLPEKIISMQLLLPGNMQQDYSKEEEKLSQILDQEVSIRTGLPDGSAKDKNRRIPTAYYDVYLTKPLAEQENPDVSIYVVTHKDYLFQISPGYIPICVGNYVHDGWLTERTGDSIHELNGKINEMTAIYWIWKNRPSKYVGICHYRRYFYNDEFAVFENYLRSNQVVEYLEHNDMIVCYRENATGDNPEFSIINELKMPLSEKAFEIGYEIVLRNLEQVQPEYVDDFRAVMAGTSLCYYNMFVTRWEIYDAFCSWLFSFLIPAAKEFDAEQFKGADRRTIGFFAERMLSVWLHRNPQKLKPLSVYLP